MVPSFFDMWAIPRIKWDNVCHLLHYGIGPFFLQTHADISLVKYSHMCDLQHHGTDLFWAIYVGFSI